LEIVYFNEIDSTQKYLLNMKSLKDNICIWSENQTNGIGSRGNNWIGEKGNLFFSFSIKKTNLPDDLPLQSLSIYFMYNLKIVLKKLGSCVKFKWPNDLFLKNKVAGCITNIKNDIIICGIGVNTKKSKEFSSLDIEIDNYTLLKLYFNLLKQKTRWEDIFKLLNVELSEKLNKDGSININNKRIYSLR